MSEITLIEKIKQDAAQAVEEIKTAGTAEVESIQREIQAEVEELRKKHAADLEKAKNQLELVAVSKAKQAGNIAVQTAKRTQIDSILNGVAGELEGQDSADYVSFFAKYAKEVLPKEVVVEHVHAPAKREEETEKVLKELGIDGKVEKNAAIKAGFVIHAKDGVYDVTLGRLLNDKRDELEMVIVNTVMS